jgi:hypothetical protein
MSAFELIPQAITIYPNDSQVFTGRGTPPPPMWKSITSGKVLSDYSLQLNPSSDAFVEGFGAHALYSEIGYVEFLVDDNMRPTSTGYIQMQSTIVTDTGSYAYIVKILATSIEIYKEGPVLLTTISYSVVSGDRFKLQLASGWRLYRNGVFLHERISLVGAVRYPMGYGCAVVKPVAGTIATVHRPDLTGDWRLLPEVSFTTPSHGSLSTTGPASSTIYSGGVQPGVYTLVGQISPSSDPDGLQKTSATITIPPLAILGSDSVTLQPGQKARFRTNYDAAQNKIVSWSIISGGGSFTNDEFTAPSTPGTTVVRASNSANTSVAQITVTVPSLISGTVGSIAVTAAQASEVISFTSNMTGTKTWTASCGTAGPFVGATFSWTAPSTTGGSCKITVTNGTLTATLDIPVLKKFPYDPSGPVESDGTKSVLISDSEDATNRATRVKNKGGAGFRAGEVKFNGRDKTEFLAAYAFWDEHYPGKRCIIQDSFVGKRWVVWIDSDMKWSVASDCSIDYAFRIKESLT